MLAFLLWLKISIKKKSVWQKKSRFAYSLESYQMAFIILTLQRSLMREFTTGIPYEEFLQNLMPVSHKESEILTAVRRNIELRKEKQKAQEELEALMKVKSQLLKRNAGRQRREKKRRARIQKIRQGAMKRLAAFYKENHQLKSVEVTCNEEPKAQRAQ